jgi:hypothetical protein
MDNQNQELQLSEVVFAWQHYDYVAYKKDKKWYFFSILLLLIAVGWSFYDQNFLFGVILIMFYMIVLIYESRQPQLVDFVVTPLGIMTGKKFYYWREIEHFYIIYRAQGIKNLYLELSGVLGGRLVIPLDGQNAVALRDYFLRYIKEDLEREAEPIGEQFRRLLRF